MVEKWPLRKRRRDFLCNANIALHRTTRLRHIAVGCFVPGVAFRGHFRPLIRCDLPVRLDWLAAEQTVVSGLCASQCDISLTNCAAEGANQRALLYPTTGRPRIIYTGPKHYPLGPEQDPSARPASAQVPFLARSAS